MRLPGTRTLIRRIARTAGTDPDRVAAVTVEPRAIRVYGRDGDVDEIAVPGRWQALAATLSPLVRGDGTGIHVRIRVGRLIYAADALRLLGRSTATGVCTGHDPRARRID